VHDLAGEELEEAVELVRVDRVGVLGGREAAVADLGGATIALRAYEKSLEKKRRQTIDGFTPEQRFFLGFAQVWGENMSPQEATRRALTDPHAQGPFRVNGTVQNMPEFWKAYNCTDSDKMVREATKRCAIW